MDTGDSAKANTVTKTVLTVKLENESKIVVGHERVACRRWNNA